MLSMSLQSMKTLRTGLVVSEEKEDLRLRKEKEERISVLKLNVGPRCDEHLQLC